MIDAKGAKAPENASDIVDVENHLPTDWGDGFKGRVLYYIAIAFSLFQISTALYAAIPSQVLRAMHVGFLVLVAACLIANHFKSKFHIALGWAFGLLGFSVGVFQWVFYADLVNRSGEVLPQDWFFGLSALITLFVISWRVMGPSLPLICLAFFAYALFGQHLPSPLNHRGYGFEQVLEYMAFGTEGIYSVPTAVSATYIFLFILFGTFLERAGMIQLFTDFSLGLVGHKRGGAGKVAVVSSALMGTISGSGVANVVTTGQFTIPLMKRFGYKPTFAGGVEATASMGGQIMPPVMGAVAFIMAENIDVPYVEIAKAAIIPALLYFASAFWMVHLEAGKHGLLGMPKDEVPNPIAALKKQWHLVLPLAVLVYLLMQGFTPLFSGSVGLALTTIMILGASFMLGFSHQALRMIFWVCIGVMSASFLWYGVFVLVGIVALLVALNLFIQGGVQTLVLCRDALAEGARQALPVGLACAIVGIVIGTMALTGAATTLGQFIVSFGEHSLLLSLVLVMLTCILLGTGLPTIPTYIITSSLAAPALLKLGVPLLVSHMFVFYFGILADLTPPVALAALAAAPIAKASPHYIGFQATRIALAGFLLPYLAVYEPILMLQKGGEIAAQYGYWAEFGFVFFKASLSIALIGILSIGFLFERLNVWQRLMAGVCAVLIIAQVPYTTSTGLMGAAILLSYLYIKKPKLA